ncbi:PREDICTED: HORMA domain-containing protein 2 [Dipodomys ordii]|uniref:HORMA domain-containing protein 2 n=1 Tax=Dipodomys ordii TaxID=10020 RepID=A0A1S3F1R9_DIPOR|nr:PREDICTED: HORMA domain-containing protein 2 [Dipodomys ordii]
MSTAQLAHAPRTHKTSKKTVFPTQITNEQQSLIMVKKLFATSISCITYLRGLFPESSYGERHLDAGLHMAVLTLYTNPKEPEKVTEIYQFKFKYTKYGATMDFDSSNTSFDSRGSSEDIKRASILLIRKLYILMQNLEPLPNDVILTMKLHYYNAVTPHDYQPPGFKEAVNSHFLLFDGDPVNMHVGVVSTGFHKLKVKVTTETNRVSDPEDSMTEIVHQGLDYEEEEEEYSNQVRPSSGEPPLLELNAVDPFPFEHGGSSQ